MDVCYAKRHNALTPNEFDVHRNFENPNLNLTVL